MRQPDSFEAAHRASHQHPLCYLGMNSQIKHKRWKDGGGDGANVWMLPKLVLAPRCPTVARTEEKRSWYSIPLRRL